MDKVYKINDLLSQAQRSGITRYQENIAIRAELDRMYKTLHQKNEKISNLIFICIMLGIVAIGSFCFSFYLGVI